MAIKKAFNKANGCSLNHLTAKELMLYTVEGVDVYTTPLMWKRIRKQANKKGLVLSNSVTLTQLAKLEVDVAIEYCNDITSEDIDLFIEEMQIMGFLEDEEDND